MTIACAPLRHALAAALLVLATGCGTNGPTAGSPEPGATTLRVMTFNIHHGAGPDDVMDLEHVAAVIRQENPDVVALQEVDRGVSRSGGRDLLRELSALTGLPHYAFGKNIDYGGGDYGNGLLSRHPIRQEVNSWLPQIEAGERRGVLQTLIDVGGRRVAVLGTHLDVRNAQERELSSRHILDAILPRYAETPTVVTGDFNALPDSEVYRLVTARLGDAWTTAGEGPGYTIPVHAPARRIDFVFHSPHLVPVAARVPRTDASDHLPLVVDFRFAD